MGISVILRGEDVIQNAHKKIGNTLGQIWNISLHAWCQGSICQEDWKEVTLHTL